MNARAGNQCCPEGSKYPNIDSIPEIMFTTPNIETFFTLHLCTILNPRVCVAHLFRPVIRRKLIVALAGSMGSGVRQLPSLVTDEYPVHNSSGDEGNPKFY